DFDIHAVSNFAPTIDADAPLWRHYRLMSRYQHFYWGVFRTGVLASGLKAAQAMRGIVFREVTVMNTAILQGKVALLHGIDGLRGTEQSHTPIAESHPLYWAIQDGESFFRNYLVYRNALAQFIRERAIAIPQGSGLEQLLDVVHATWWGR